MSPPGPLWLEAAKRRIQDGFVVVPSPHHPPFMARPPYGVEPRRIPSYDDVIVKRDARGRPVLWAPRHPFRSTMPTEQVDTDERCLYGQPWHRNLGGFVAGVLVGMWLRRRRRRRRAQA